ncbi:MAG TPA: HPP family protein [Bauldia sp.]|nr:HPP family protein [Bauldia sp.]
MSDMRKDGAFAPALARAFGAFEPVTGKVVREAALAGLGGAVTLGVLAVCAWMAVTPLIIAPFGASCVLLFAVPASPLAQPRNVIGGHMLSALIGIAVLALLGPSPLAMAVAVGIAIAAMRLTGTVHPPAGADPIVVIAAGAHWWFFAVPVGIGAAILVVCAVVYHRFVTGLPYPKAG